MNAINSAVLKPAFPRCFVPEGADLTNKDVVVGLLNTLLSQEVSSGDGFEQWILDNSEFGAAISQAGSILYIEMTCATDDPAKAGEYQAFVENVEPAVKPLSDELNKKFLLLAEKFPLDKKRYEVSLRAAKADVALFVDKNVPLQTEVALLSQEYQSVSGAMSVHFDGQDRTLPEMSKFLLMTDRGVRERAWRATAARRMQDKDRFEAIFDKMLVLRQKIAVNAGCTNFRDYMFKAYHRFDYTPDDCKAYQRAIKDIVVPLRREIDLRRQQDMNLDRLRPWDGAVDPLGRAPLEPFKTAGQLIEGVERMISRLDSDLAGLYRDMKGLGLLDLESRKGKAPGGYQNTLNEARKPFIFMNAVGIDDDVRTLLHESGHAFHAYLSAHDPLVEYRHAPMEFCEVASMSMELMADEFTGEFYSVQDAKRSTVELLEGLVSTLAWVATIDAFQHWIYENPGHTPQDRRAAWGRLNAEFGGGVVDWSGLEEERSYLWHRQLHIFEVPFYYIEYGIAQLGALQIWQRFKDDPRQAVSYYKKGLSLGGSRPLPELFAAAGIRFDFSKEMIVPLVDTVYRQWKDRL
ncbi:MAG: M3 family oligoendopeptidase [Candidatus Omnitrophica bacterium]|nr:M3 family oligoendopeptidase [Candidatus Omnitrophota bacterium]